MHAIFFMRELGEDKMAKEKAKATTEKDEQKTQDGKAAETQPEPEPSKLDELLNRRLTEIEESFTKRLNTLQDSLALAVQRGAIINEEPKSAGETAEEADSELAELRKQISEPWDKMDFSTVKE